MKTLVLIDIQNDFLPGGALAVPEGDLIVPVVNRLLPEFELIVATQDWHPADHGSFAASHPGQAVYSQGELNGLPQTFWPVHCVQNTGGALFAPGLETRRIARVFPKGVNPGIDSYSGLFDNGHRVSTGMGEWLKAAGAAELWVAGLATDYCVKFTVLDALREGFAVNVLSRACRGVDLTAGDCVRALEEMQASGAKVID
ncbi:MAG: bifunctional nicotinamidase/pyrazinamidase [Verrucomicrobiaceae bacterium]|nr:MAG: bifunctional nicotinamidase/pyrazinamidase [Verrucomicrobiaceae bacterium]